MQLKVVTTQSGIKEIKQYLEDKEIVAYDSETTGLKFTDTIVGFSVCASEDLAYYVVLSTWTKDGNWLLPVLDVPYKLLEIIKSKSLIMHNAIFDCAMAESFFKVRLIDSLHTDTMVLAHLLDENRPIGLKPLAKQYFGEDSVIEQQEMKASVIANGGIWEESKKGIKEMYKADSNLLGKYGAKDALLTFKLFYVLLDDLVEQGLEDFFYEDESMPLLKGPTYELNTVGLKVDQTKLIELKQTLKAECAEMKDFIYREIEKHIKHKYPGTKKSNTFNIGASQQMAWLLFGQLGLEFGKLTKGGKAVCKELGVKVPYYAAAKREFIARCEEMAGQPMTPDSIVNGKKKKGKKFKQPWAYIAAGKEIIAKYSDRYKWLETLLKYNKNNKILSTYVLGIEERMEYGIIRPSFLQSGTTSGRYSSKNPNFQNLPRDDKRVKGAITARPGKVFVGADYSQLEPRVFTYYSRDARLTAAFQSGDDWYSVIGIGVFGKHECTASKGDEANAFKVMYKGLRQDTKVFCLASTYGGSAFQLAGKLGKSERETQEQIDAYFEAFPGVREMQLEAHRLVKQNGYVENLFGRKRRIPEAKRIDKLFKNVPHAELDYAWRTLLNLAVNHRIQSTGASIVNRAAIRMHKDKAEHRIAAKLVVQVHDSLIYECDAQDAEIVEILLQEAMENTVKLGEVPLEAVPKTGLSLADV